MYHPNSIPERYHSFFGLFRGVISTIIADSIIGGITFAIFFINPKLKIFIEIMEIIRIIKIKSNITRANLIKH